MTHKTLKLTLAGIVVAGAVTYLGLAGMKQGAAYTIPVDQFVAEIQQQHGRVRLCGTVAEKGLEVNRGQLRAQFYLQGEKSQVFVSYKGVVPEMFRAGSEVIAEGKGDGKGTFVCDVLMTKCASKYEDKPKSHPPVAGNGQKSSQESSDTTLNTGTSKP